MAETEKQVAYITVTGDEVEKILPQMERLSGFRIPYPNWSSVEVAVSEGHIVGFAPLYLVPHADGMWVAENYRGTDVAQQLADRIQKTAEGNYMPQMICMTQNDYVKKLCLARGMKEKGTYTVFVKE